MAIYNRSTNYVAQLGIIFFAIQESLEGGFEAKALSHCIYTEADTLDELKRKVQDAVRCHFGDYFEIGRVTLLKDRS